MLYRFRHRIAGPLVIAWLLLTVASVFTGLIVWSHLAENLRSTEETTLLGDELGSLYSTLQNAESNERGYLLTGDENYLAEFDKAKAAMSGALTRVANISARDQVLQGDVLQLRRFCELKISQMSEAIARREKDGSLASSAVLDSGKGGDPVKHIQEIISHMRAQGHSLFSEAGLATRRQLQLGQDITLLAGALGVGTGLIGLYLVRVGYLQDKAQRELLEEKLRAEKTVSEKSAFLANMSHEIRTPMNAILGFGELLEGENISPKQAQYVHSIRQSGSALLQLINDVLDLSKFEAGRLQLHLEPTDVRELCGFLQTMFVQQAAAKSLELKFDVGSAPRALLMDRLRLRQVLVNLIGNAIKFTPEGFVNTEIRWINDADDRSQGTLIIAVSDSGAGISFEKQKDIFEPFVQAASNGAAENQGVGLGLNIVKRLMEMMRGTVTLESAPGKGSVFRLQFPHVSVSARLPVNDLVEATEAVDFNDFDPTTFLVVDDNETNRNLIINIFENTHHRVCVARDGRGALESIAKIKPGLVLLDIRMPLMDGKETLAEIRRIPDFELLPVIAVTASSLENDRRGVGDSFSGYLRKPFSQRMLYKELQHFLRRATNKSGPNGPVQPPELTVATAKRAPDWDLLLTELRILYAGEWGALRESLAINETQAFAQKLCALAARTGCSQLAAYGETLAAHAEAYAVRDLEEHLSAFPVLIQSIKYKTELNCG